MGLRRKIVAILALCAVLFTLPPAAVAQLGAPATIEALAAQAAQSPENPARPYDERDWLVRFYAPRSYAPAWTPPQAAAALALLQQAPEEGLDPQDYDVAALQGQLQGAAADPADPGRLDAALTAAMLHYLADLRVGRVRSEYHTSLPDPRLQEFDPVERLRGALAGDRLAEAVHAAEPAIALYARIKATLATYRQLATLPYPALPQPVAEARPGESYRGARLLFERLELLGDLPPDAEPPEKSAYGPDLAAGVRSFQSRHGLREDGVLGAATIAALNVPPERRVRQLELTLERLRWLPDLAPGPLITIDLPAYRLWAYPATPDAAPLEMRVVVGAAIKTPTPLFVGEMLYLEFNPYWNIPRSIALKEIIPKLSSNPDYLAQHDMELVPPHSTLPALRSGKARVRQRPGPRNALGAVKFAMPNPMDIYLHSTPSRQLFKRSRRDLSHGCIRVEQPVALVRFLLADQPQWDTDQIEAVMAPGRNRRVDLSAPVPVVILYATAMLDGDGKARFVPDVYKLDPALEQALAAHTGQIVPAPPALTE
jgi:murein L,D-transpeptidase YcbB/YkuD